MTETRFEVAVEGGALSVLHIPRDNAPRLFFAHANGFNAATYRQFLKPLSQHFEIIAPDTRGHGLSQMPLDMDGLGDWFVFGRDLATVGEALDKRPTFFVGHSMGAVCGLLAAGLFDLQIDGIALIEPVFMPSWFYAVPHIPGGAYIYKFNPMSAGAKRRREYWDSREDVLERYRGKRLFADWAPGVLEDYLETGTLDAEDQVRLACSPLWEAAIFAAQGHNPWTALRKLDHSVPILRSTAKGSTVYPVWRLQRQSNVRLETTNAGHLAPMEEPQACADWVLAQAADLIARDRD